MKIKKRIFSLALAGALTMGLLPAFSSPALAAEGDTSYTLTIPSTLTVANSGWNATDGISATGTLASGKKLTVTATSGDEFALVNQSDNTQKVGYTLATASTDTTATTSWTFDSLSGTAATKPMGIIVEDYSAKPAGTYQDTVTFTASVEDNLVSFTIMRDVNRNSSGNYTVAPGTTWQQFIDSGDAPSCLSKGTWGNYNGKVCHDMNGNLTCCGRTLIANVADKKRVKIGDAIIDGATYGCSDYLDYEDHD